MATTGKLNSRQSRKQQRAAQHRRSLIQTMVLIAAGLLALGALVVVSLSTPNGVIAPARIGQPISNFTLTDLNGQTHQLSDYAGRPVLINGWATWCPPCRAEMPDLYAFYLAHKADGLELLAINAGESAATSAAFINKQGFTFPVLIDPNQRVLSGLGVDGFPTSILVGRDGKVKYIHVGQITPDVLQTTIAPLLAQ
jgi:peroxiredoxin